MAISPTNFADKWQAQQLEKQVAGQVDPQFDPLTCRPDYEHQFATTLFHGKFPRLFGTRFTTKAAGGTVVRCGLWVAPSEYTNYPAYYSKGKNEAEKMGKVQLAHEKDGLETKKFIDEANIDGDDYLSDGELAAQTATWTAKVWKVPIDEDLVERIGSISCLSELNGLEGLSDNAALLGILSQSTSIWRMKIEAHLDIRILAASKTLSSGVKAPPPWKRRPEQLGFLSAGIIGAWWLFSVLTWFCSRRWGLISLTTATRRLARSQTPKWVLWGGIRPWKSGLGRVGILAAIPVTLWMIDLGARRFLGEKQGLFRWFGEAIHPWAAKFSGRKGESSDT